MRYGLDKEKIMSRFFHEWCDKSKKIGQLVNGSRIAYYIASRYKISTARNYWRDLSSKLRFNNYSNEAKLLITTVKKVVLLQRLLNNLNLKIEKDAIKQLKSGNTWLKILSVLRRIFSDQDKSNQGRLLNQYLKKWKNTVERLNERTMKLGEALDLTFKRVIINNCNTLSNGFISTHIIKSVPVARSIDFLRLFHTRYNKALFDFSGQKQKLRLLIIRLLRNYGSVLGKKFYQWNDISSTIGNILILVLTLVFENLVES